VSAAPAVPGDAAEAVRRTIAAYCQALDDGRTDDVVACFCDDAKIDIPGQGVFEGIDAIREAFSGWLPQVPQRHLVLNTVLSTCDGEGQPGRIHALSDLVFVVKTGDPASWRVQLVGRYDDMFRRDPDGTWRIHRRRAEFS
jgi:ketosteroid isomerase-like protein